MSNPGHLLGGTLLAWLNYNTQQDSHATGCRSHQNATIPERNAPTSGAGGLGRGRGCALWGRARRCKESAPGTIGSIVKWPDAAQTYLLVVDDPNGQFHVINRADGNLVGSFGRVGHQLGEFYNLHFIGIDSKGNVYSAEVQGKRVQKFRNLGGL